MLSWSCSPKTVSHCRRAVNRHIYPTPSVLKVRVEKNATFTTQMWPNNIFWATFTFSFFELSCLATIVSTIKCAPSPNLPYAPRTSGRWKIQDGIPLGLAQGEDPTSHTLARASYKQATWSMPGLMHYVPYSWAPYTSNRAKTTHYIPRISPQLSPTTGRHQQAVFHFWRRSRSMFEKKI